MEIQPKVETQKVEPMSIEEPQLSTTSDSDIVDKKSDI